MMSMTMTNARRFAALALMLSTLCPPPVGAAESDPATGIWQVYSDKDGSQEGRVRVFVQEGKLVGVVAELRADAPPDSRCTKCSGAQKDKPIRGLTVMWGFEKDGEAWTGGTALEPQTGNTYRCKVRYVAPDTLEVRGYVGLTLFGRTQTWKRAR
jgi:uncharacterized protein (DUF2147 family)